MEMILMPNDKQTHKFQRSLVRPRDNSPEASKEAALELFRMITCREPTDDEMRELELKVQEKKQQRERVRRELRQDLGREPTEQEVNLSYAQMDHLGFL